MTYRFRRVHGWSGLLVLILSLLITAWQTGLFDKTDQVAEQDQPGLYSVAHFVDGDTIALSNGQRVRLVAVDLDGKEHPAEVRSGTGVKDFRQIVVEFDQTPQQIKEFWFQTRPYERVEIPRISLQRK